MKKVLMLGNSDIVIYNFRKELVERLLDDGYEVVISSPYGEKIDDLISIGCKYIETKIERHGTNLFKDLKLAGDYRRILKKEKPDIVLSYTIKPNIYGSMACKLSKITCIPNITGLGTAVGNGGLIQGIILSLYKFSFKNLPYLFFQNTNNLNFFKKKNIIKDNYKLIPGSGVNLKEYGLESYPEDDGIIRFLFLGRIMKDKGIEELVQAAKEIKRIYKNVEFEAIGFCEDEYKNRALELKSMDVIKFSCSKKDVREDIKKCNALILPSYHEGMSNVLLEAASTGRPVLTSKIAGCQETFDEGISGFGFEVKNVDSLVKTITKFIELPYQDKKNMGIKARKKMEQEFDRNIVVDLYMEVIEEILDKIGDNEYELI